MIMDQTEVLSGPVLCLEKLRRNMKAPDKVAGLRAES